MLEPPKIPWPIRLIALVFAAGMSLYVVQLYVFGAKFVGAVNALAKPPIAAPASKGEPGLVPVRILSETKTTH